MKSRISREPSRFALLWLAVGGTAVLGCSGTDPSTGSSAATPDAAKVSQAVWPEELLERTLVPIRALKVPGNVHLTTIEQRVDGTGTFSQIFHVYQPDSNGETIRFEVGARTSTGTIDSAQRFQAVTVTSRPGEPDQTQQTFADASGQSVYSVSTSRQGWYRFQFTYVAPNSGRTLRFRAYDAGSSSLKIGWSDPPSARVQVKATVQVQQATRVFLKGGAYRTADRSQSASADSVTVDGRLLYRSSFDQGNFNFPLGWLNAGTHTVDFALQASAYNPAKFWFGINDETFDPLARFTEWSPVQFLYYGETRTADYDAWNEGVAFAQGAAPGRGVRPAPIRRGSSLGVALTHSSLNGTSANATVRVYRQGSNTQLNWAATRQTNGDYAGGIYTSTGFSTRYREHWRVAVPANAPVGRYVLRAFAPNGSQIGANVAFYVIYDPFTLVSSGRVPKPELDTYGYDEDEDGMNMKDTPFGADADAQRDHFSAIYYGDPASGQFSPDSEVTGAFRRTNEDVTSLSVLDYAMAAGDGTSSEFETMRRVFRLASQQRKYGGSDRSDDIARDIVPSADDVDGFRLSDAAVYSRPNTEILYPGQAVCYSMAGILTAYARSAGILARAVTAQGLGGWAEHAFTEVYIPDLPRHGGTTTSSASSPESDTDPWYVFDATDPGGNAANPTWIQHSQAISPRAQYGRAFQMINGLDDQLYATTTPVEWDFRQDSEMTTNARSVTSAYAAGPDYWLSRSGITGWLGYWERDVYRVQQGAGATRVSVRTLPNDGEFLQPLLCVAPVTTNPPLPERCASPSASVTLPAGESYVVVFNGTEPLPRYRGDSVQYVLELQ
jgi:hypothetical protein